MVGGFGWKAGQPDLAPGREWPGSGGRLTEVALDAAVEDELVWGAVEVDDGVQ